MHTGIVLINFGEPEVPTLESVTRFLERIFRANASLDGDLSAEAVSSRSLELARRRAPGLLEAYDQIGGSPLNPQARAQLESTCAALARRGYDVNGYPAFQFTDPSIPEAVEQAIADGVTRLVGLPVYPLCGPSTTVAALAELRAAVETVGTPPELIEVSGWHRHPAYARLRAENVRARAASRGIDLHDRGTALVFTAHGTPLEYLRGGGRYVDYVEEHCAAIAALAGVDRFELGYQNHANRGIEWTGPDLEDVVDSIDAEALVIEAVSFIHEQSETLSELDRDIRERVESRGIRFCRVPIPHDEPAFAELLADLVEAALRPDAASARLLSCRCRPGGRCLSGD